jgi:hypothetical protein
LKWVQNIFGDRRTICTGGYDKKLNMYKKSCANYVGALKDSPDLTSKIPRKTNKADKALPGNKSDKADHPIDDPASRIDPSEPIVPVATLPNKDSQDKDTETEPEGNQASNLQLVKRILNGKRTLDR